MSRPTFLTFSTLVTLLIFLFFLTTGCSGSSSSSSSSSSGSSNVTPTDNVFTFEQINEPVIPVSTCTRLAVGAPYSRQEKGSVYVFDDIDTNQPSSVLVAQSYPSYPMTTDKIHFGVSLSMTPDANRILVGGMNWPWGLESGYFYHLYDDVQNLWQQTFIQGLGFASAGYEVGFSGALSSDGQMFLMGGKNNDKFIPISYAYDLQINAYNRVPSFEPSGGSYGLRLGWAYKNSYDDTYIVMSAVSRDNTPQGSFHENKVFVYTYSDILKYSKGKSDWMGPDGPPSPSNPVPQQTIEISRNDSQQYGVALDLSLDNQWLIVGQSLNEKELSSNVPIQGMVDIRKYDGTSNEWQSNKTFTESYWDYASSLSLSPDGTWLAVGAASGSLVYLYENVSGTWTDRGTIQGDDPQPSDNFGKSLFLSMDVNTGTLLVGANQKDNGKGAVYVFTYDGSSWSQSSVIQPSTLVDNDQFGYSLTCNVDTR